MRFRTAFFFLLLGSYWVLMCTICGNIGLVLYYGIQKPVAWVTGRVSEYGRSLKLILTTLFLVAIIGLPFLILAAFFAGQELYRRYQYRAEDKRKAKGLKPAST